MNTARRHLALAAALACMLPLAGCERFFRNMYDQPRLAPGDRSPLFSDGPASRPPPPGSLPMAVGDAALASSAGRGADAAERLSAAEDRTALPAVPGRALLLRGQERYTVYCLPCHGAVGDGDGMVVRRGFPAPPSFHQDRLRQATDRHFYDAISQGYGVMNAFADRVEPDDRWAIVAYVRALQASQQVPLAALPAALQARLAPQLVQASPPERGSGEKTASPAPATGAAAPAWRVTPPDPVPAAARQAPP